MSTRRSNASRYLVPCIKPTKGSLVYPTGSVWEWRFGGLVLACSMQLDRLSCGAHTDAGAVLVLALPPLPNSNFKIVPDIFGRLCTPE